MMAIRGVALMLLAAAVAAKPLSVRWGQDNERLFLTIGMDCKESTFNPMATSFLLRCRPTGTYVNFNLREDIVPEKSSCKTNGRGEQECILLKAVPHTFDRLTAKIGEIPGLKQDWGHFKEEDEGAAAEHPYAKTSDKVVRPMNREALEKAAAEENTVVFADVYYPWCTHCTRQMEDFAAAASVMASDKLIFAKVDAREDRSAIGKYNVTCKAEVPCGVWAFRAGEGGVFIDAKMNKDDMMAYLQSNLDPTLQAMDEKEVVEFLAKHETAAVVVIKGSFLAGPKQTKSYKVAKKAAEFLRGTMRVVMTEKSVQGAPVKSLSLFVNGTLKISLPVSDKENATKLAATLAAHAVPPLDTYTWSKRAGLAKLGVPIMHVFLGEEHAAERETFLALAEKFAGRLISILIPRADTYMMKEFTLPEGKLPAFGIAQGFDPKHDRFAYKGGDFSLEPLTAFVDSVMNGTAKASRKSASAQADWTRGNVKAEVWDTLSARTPEDEALLLILYKPWDESYKKDHVVLERVAQAFSNLEGIVVAHYDMNKNYVNQTAFPASPDSQIFLVQGDAPPEQFKGSVSQKEIFKFLAKRVAAVKKGWEEKVKPRLKQIKDAEAVRKKAEEAEKAAAAVKAESERVELEKKLKSAEKKSLSADGKTVKQVLVEGSGDSPKQGDQVEAHYTGTLLDGTKFDSSRDPGRSPFKFAAGEGQVIQCWDIAFMSMKRGERAVLTCEHEHAYGARGSPPTIPPAATLRFDVELIDFEPKAGKLSGGQHPGEAGKAEL
mmetsp:Transcript_10541/g.25658  ORF Transcript_10541/g.25658 Transcript_10541/m.25658 type:complete len:775 (+) Transcript_10541:22-2346(+)